MNYEFNARKNNHLIVQWNIANMAERSEAKSAKRNCASNILKFCFWREASFQAFSFASLSHIWDISVNN